MSVGKSLAERIASLQASSGVESPVLPNRSQSCCKHCGEFVPQKNKFCGNCGKPVKQTPKPPSMPIKAKTNPKVKANPSTRVKANPSTRVKAKTIPRVKAKTSSKVKYAVSLSEVKTSEREGRPKGVLSLTDRIKSLEDASGEDLGKTVMERSKSDKRSYGADKWAKGSKSGLSSQTGIPTVKPRKRKAVSETAADRNRKSAPSLTDRIKLLQIAAGVENLEKAPVDRSRSTEVSASVKKPKRRGRSRSPAPPPKLFSKKVKRLGKSASPRSSAKKPPKRRFKESLSDTEDKEDTFINSYPANHFTFKGMSGNINNNISANPPGRPPPTPSIFVGKPPKRPPPTPSRFAKVSKETKINKPVKSQRKIDAPSKIFRPRNRFEREIWDNPPSRPPIVPDEFKEEKLQEVTLSSSPLPKRLTAVSLPVSLGTEPKIYGVGVPLSKRANTDRSIAKQKVKRNIGKKKLLPVRKKLETLPEAPPKFTTRASDGAILPPLPSMPAPLPVNNS